MSSVLKTGLLLFVVFFLTPLAVSAVLYLRDGTGAGWRTADRSSAGLLPRPERGVAVVRVFSAPTVRWRGILATHCWIVFKSAGATSYTRYDYTAWGGQPIRMNGFEPDGRWFGRIPEVVFAADGDAAEAMIEPMQAAIEGYAWSSSGDYNAWPGPNSNTFVAAVMDSVPGIHVALPPTAIGKDFPYDGQWLRRTPSGTGLRLTLGGYGGITLGWAEGIEVNILGVIAGLDLRRPAIKLPGLGRLGMPGEAG